MSSPPGQHSSSNSSDSPSPTPRSPEHRRSDKRHSSRRISGNFQAPLPPYGPGGVLNSPRHRSDSTTSLSRNGNKSLGTRVTSNNNSPPSFDHMHSDTEHEQDMADLTAEMALLDDDHAADSRSGRIVLTSPKGTGGLRPLSLGSSVKKPGHSRGLSTESFYRDDFDDVEGYGSKPKSRPSYSSEKSENYRKSGILDPESLDTLNRKRTLAMWDRFIYRVRFCLRVLSLIASGVVVSSLAHLTEVYNRTKNNKDIDGKLIWAVNLSLGPTNVLLAGAVVATAMTLLWTALSVKSSFKMLIGGKTTLAALLSTLLTFGFWIGAIVHCGVIKDTHQNGVTTMFLVCEFANNPPIFANFSSAIDFQFHCGEIRIAWFTSLAIAIADSLILLTIIIGWVFRWWHVGGRKNDTNFWSAPTIAEVGARG